MIDQREDVTCPACPADTAFTIEDIGMKFDFDGEFGADGTLRFTASRPAWESAMIEHLRDIPDERHQQLYQRCLTSLDALGKTPEQAAWDTVQAAAGWGARSIASRGFIEVPARDKAVHPLSFAEMRQTAEAQTMQPARPVALPGALR